MSSDRTARRLLAMNDSRLGAFLSSQDSATRELELERLLERLVRPVAHRTVEAYARGDFPISSQDVDDVVSNVTLRMIVKLRAATVHEDDSIQDLEAYVVTLTRNALRDLMRRRSPARARLRGRLRYLMSSDDRIVCWSSDGVNYAALKAVSQRPPVTPRAEQIRAIAARVPPDLPHARDALYAALHILDGPVRVSRLIEIFIDLWRVEEEQVSTFPEELPHAERVEWRDYLRMLWTEIRSLPGRQQTALLLNLRTPLRDHAMAIFLATGIAQLDEIAAAIGVTRSRLLNIWDDLPLDDAAIARELGGISRQQVINLRKSARQRLSRRMALHVKPYR